MLIDLCNVSPGELPDDVFNELVEGTSYSPDMVAALREHLVHGDSIKDAIKAHGLLPHKFKMRLGKLTEEISKAGRIVAMITQQSDGATDAERQQSPSGSLDEALKLSRALTKTLESMGL